MKNLGKAYSVGLVGIEGYRVEVEAHNSSGLPKFSIVGLPDTSLNESKERIRSVYHTSGLEWSHGHMTVNLSPSSMPKRGSNFDLAIFVATLKSLDPKVEKDLYPNYAWFGELSLDGRLRPIEGILPLVSNAKKLGFTHIAVPVGNLEEAKLIEDIEIYEFGHIFEIVEFLGGEVKKIEYKPVVNNSYIKPDKAKNAKDFIDVIGQDSAKFGMEIAAAGRHNLLMVGPPGVGKSMLASRMPTILPELSHEDSLEVTSIHSLSGTLKQQKLITAPPFEAPHHTATAPSIIGGGTNVKPGSVSRAHKGILFLDEAPEFSPHVLQTLRAPLENRFVQIDRANSTVRYPCDIQLLLAANPCPCGYNIGDGLKCKCSAIQKRRYFSRLSGPLLDRIDVQLQVQNIKTKNFDNGADTSKTVLNRVKNARDSQLERLNDTPWKLNSEVPGSYMRNILKNSELIPKLNNLVDKGILSLRGSDRTLRLAWTLADLEGKLIPDNNHIDIALSMRILDL
jgi:magnesium chelatase family protein